MRDREKFYLIVNQFGLHRYWDQENHEIRLKNFDAALGLMSSGEAIFARFMANVWFGEDKYPFNITDAAGTLGQEHKKVIIEWLANPYWP